MAFWRGHRCPMDTFSSLVFVKTVLASRSDIEVTFRRCLRRHMRLHQLVNNVYPGRLAQFLRD